MRENYTQAGYRETNGRLYIEGDWYDKGLPASVTVADSAYIDTSYGFTAFRAIQPGALFIDEASGCYDRSSFIVSENGKVEVGKFTILNGTTIVCKEQIVIGNHCMLAWGSVLTDTWVNAGMLSLKARQALLIVAAEDPTRSYPFFGRARPIVLEDNCWVGFDSVILPGVRLGRGCVVGCKTIISNDVPPYAVITGSPARIVRYLHPNDTEDARQDAISTYIKS
jgi:acetyltransferase-like isoleucine patch superfamily enzyme